MKYLQHESVISSSVIIVLIIFFFNRFTYKVFLIIIQQTNPCLPNMICYLFMNTFELYLLFNLMISVIKLYNNK
jgi:hypothetical protein